MRARPVALLALLSACVAPNAALDTAVQPLDGPGARAEIDMFGLRMSDGLNTLTLTTTAWGREGALATQPLVAPEAGTCWLQPPGRLQVAGCIPSVERSLAGGVERWRRVGAAAEQGWTLTNNPTGTGLILIEVEVGGATPSVAGELVQLDTTSGTTWTYGGLRAWDDAGAPLPAWLGVDGDHIQVWVDDADATWPIHVDPVLSTASTSLTRSSTD
jgi:hypothetical protein